jgi:hypothetical protein
MQEKEPITSVNHSPKTVSIDAERTLATPHFDAAAEREARPAVPLKQLKPRRSWPVALVVLAIIGGLAGGIIGGLLATGYLKRDGGAPSAPAAEASATPATANAGATAEEGAAAAPSISEASPATEARATTEPPALVAQEPKKPESETGPQGNEEVKANDRTPQETQAALRSALNDWVAATNARDLGKQLSFYPPTINVFYRQHNAPLAVVRADRERVFERADSINVQAETPRIELSRDGRTVTMRFLKRYAIAGGGMDRSGAVVQELRWQRVGGKWRITSERDVRMVR